MNKWLVFSLSALVALGSLGGVWAQMSKETGRIEERINTVEKRQTEDRADIKERIQRIDDRVERVDQNVQQILRKLEVIDDRRTDRREHVR